MGPARLIRSPLGAAAPLAASGRHFLHRAADLRQRRCRNSALDTAVSAARRKRLADAHANRLFSCGVGKLGADRARRLAVDRRRRRRGADPADGSGRFRLFRDGRDRARSRDLYQGERRPRRTAGHRRRQSRAGEPADHPGHAGRRAGRRSQRRRSRPQCTSYPAAGRIRSHARRHAARRIQRDLARLLAALAGGFLRSPAPVQGRRDATAAARAARAHRIGAQRRHADLPRGPGTRPVGRAADEAGGDGPADREHRARGAQSRCRRSTRLRSCSRRMARSRPKASVCCR